MKLRKYLSAEGLINTVYNKLKKITDPRQFKKGNTITITDCLMSAFAMFNLKFPSLLQYDKKRSQSKIMHNLKTLFHVNDSPSDTYMRERLDEIEPQKIRSAFKQIFTRLQRGKALEQYRFLDDCYLLSIDGTGLFLSDKIHCENCCMKNHRDGRTSYYHQMLGAVLVHPDKKEVIPMCPEMIQKQDGITKNDCERNSAKRLLEHIRREHPHLKIMATEDALAANTPHLKLIDHLSMRYIVGVKPGDHDFLFDWVANSEKIYYEYKDPKGTIHKFEFINQVPLNDSNFDYKVNFIEYWEIKPNGKKQHFSWVTNVKVSKNNVSRLMKGARARWKIENETFNTLKNQGYHFEHNYGHGNKNLCHVLTLLMMLSFLIDQSQLLCCAAYKLAKQKTGRFTALWEEMRTLFKYFQINSWSQFFDSIGKEEWISDSS